MLSLILLFSSPIWVDVRRVPSISNVALIPLSPQSSILIDNATCHQCLCRTPANYSILNCFPNNTCQIFELAPRRYRIQSMPQTRLLFPNGQLPNKSSCCMPNLTQLVGSLRQATPLRVNISDPRCLVVTRTGLLLVPELTTGILYEYQAVNLTKTRQLHLNITNPWSLAAHNGTYYIDYGPNRILVVDSNQLTVVATITSTEINSTRDMMFLNDGEIMVVAATLTQSLVFFQRMNHSPSNYTFLFRQSFDSITPHGLWYVNDTFFYATSWKNNRIYSFTQVNATFWREDLFIDGGLYTSASLGYHTMKDECNRHWFMMGPAGFYIFDERSTLLTTFKPSSIGDLFHAHLTENYVLYISDIGYDQIVRIDPNISCS